MKPVGKFAFLFVAGWLAIFNAPVQSAPSAARWVRHHPARTIHVDRSRLPVLLKTGLRALLSWGSLRQATTDFQTSIDEVLEYSPEPDAVGGPSADGPRAVTVGCMFSLWDPDGYYWNLTYDARLRNSGGSQVARRQNWAYKPGINGSVESPESNPDYSYNCGVDWYVESTYIGHDQLTLNLSLPTSLEVAHALDDMSGNPPECSGTAYYYKYRDYQVKDQNSSSIQRVMTMDESFTTAGNTCSANFVSGSGTTNSSGIFRDSFFFCDNSICNNNGSCSVTRNQTWREHQTNRAVGSFTLTYTCSTFGIQ